MKRIIILGSVALLAVLLSLSFYYFYTNTGSANSNNIGSEGILDRLKNSNNITITTNAHTVMGAIETTNTSANDTEQGLKSPAYPGNSSYFVLNGSNYTETADNGTLRLTTFSVGAWFRTDMNILSQHQSFIVNKGGIGLDIPSENLNYGIWMTSTEQLAGGFETVNGEQYFAKSPQSLKSYNHYDWHYVVLTYDGSILRLYVDGDEKSNLFTAGARPDNTGAQSLRVGANSLALDDFFIGNIGEVRVWNRAVSATEVTSQYNDGMFNTTGQVAYIQH